MWQHWTNVILGLGVFGAAFLNLSGSTLVWTFALLGALVAIVGFSGAYSRSESALSHA